MKESVKSNIKQTPKRFASQKSSSSTLTKATGFLMIYMTAIFLNVGVSDEQDRTTARFAAAFLTLFIATFILNKGQLGLPAIYLLLVQIAPALGQPLMVGTLFMLFVFLME